MVNEVIVQYLIWFCTFDLCEFDGSFVSFDKIHSSFWCFFPVSFWKPNERKKNERKSKNILASTNVSVMRLLLIWFSTFFLLFYVYFFLDYKLPSMELEIKPNHNVLIDSVVYVCVFISLFTVFGKKKFANRTNLWNQANKFSP